MVGSATTMKDKKQLIDKVKHLLRRAQAPQFLHHYGPKTYKLWQHVFALFVRSYCRLSHRRTTQFLRDLGFSVASKSTLQRYAAKLRLPFWQTLLRASVGRVNKVGAIDGTGLERTNPSWHYVKRIFNGTIHRRGFFLYHRHLGHLQYILGRPAMGRLTRSEIVSNRDPTPTEEHGTSRGV